MRFAHGLAHRADDRLPTAIAAGVVFGRQMLQEKIKEPRRDFHQFAEGFRAFIADEAIRIVWRGHGHHPNGQPAFEQTIERPHSGGLAGGIGIKTQDHFIGITLEHARVVGSKRGALRRHHIFDAGHVARDGVELAFANEHALGRNDRAACFVQTIYHFAFVEEWCLGRVHVFGPFHIRLEHAPAEPNNAPLFIVDGKH